MFHDVHTSNIELSHAARRVKRLNSDRALCFSQRMIVPGERICLKVTGLSHSRNNKGVGLRFGFTSANPSSDNTLLYLGRQDLVGSEHGFWMKPVCETVLKRGCILVFCLCVGGEVYYGRNDEEYGILFAGIRTDLSLWMVVELCGTATSLELIGKCLLFLCMLS